MDVYLGVDVGSVTTKFALVSEDDELIAFNYLRTQGKPVAVVQEGLTEIQGQLPPKARKIAQVSLSTVRSSPARAGAATFRKKTRVSW